MYETARSGKAFRKPGGDVVARRGLARPAPVAERSARPEYACACGGACPRCKLRLGHSTDPEEREADRVAEQVVGRMASSTGASLITDTGRTPPPVEILGGAGSTARRSQDGASITDGRALGLNEQMAEARSEGAPLDSPLRREMESAFGRDFSVVRVHRGPRSASLSEGLNARALTHANDIFFNRGEFDPGTTQGRRLIAHELTHTAQQARAAGQRAACAAVVQRQEKIDSGDVRILTPKTQISAAEVASLAVAKIAASGSYDLVTSSGSNDAAFKKVVENIAVFVVDAFAQPNFRAVLALDFSAVDWTKAGVKDAATKRKFGAGLHAFELIRWDGGKKLQLRMNYLREITEIASTDSDAKIKAGKKKFATGSFAFKAPNAAEKKAGYKDWTSSEQNIVYMAVSRVPDAMLSHANVKGIEFYRIPKTGKFSAQYDQTRHRMEVSDGAFQVTEGKNTTTLSSPADLYKQSSGIAGDVASGFTSLTEYTILHEISHAMDWGPVRAELKDLVAASERNNVAFAEMNRLAEEHKKAKDAAEQKRLTDLFNKAQMDQAAAQKDIAKALKAFSGKTTLSGATFAETSPGKVEETNPAAQTDFEKAIAGKTASTPYAATATGEAFAEGLAQYIVNPGLLKEYRPDLYAYFKKLFP